SVAWRTRETAYWNAEARRVALLGEGATRGGTGPGGTRHDGAFRSRRSDRRCRRRHGGATGKTVTPASRKQTAAVGFRMFGVQYGRLSTVRVGAGRGAVAGGRPPRPETFAARSAR